MYTIMNDKRIKLNFATRENNTICQKASNIMRTGESTTLILYKLNILCFMLIFIFLSYYIHYISIVLSNIVLFDELQLINKFVLF